MPATELPADFLQRRSNDLPCDVHCDLARENVCTTIAAHSELRVAHLAQVEVLAHVPTDRPDHSQNQTREE